MVWSRHELLANVYLHRQDHQTYVIGRGAAWRSIYVGVALDSASLNT